MRANDDIVQIRPLEDSIKEGPRIREVVLLDLGGICDKPISIAHLDRQLSHTLDEKQSSWAELHSGSNR